MRGPRQKDFVAAVRANDTAWPDGPPDWIVALAEACTAARQSTVADQLGVSPSLLSAVLAGSYEAKGGNTANIEARVRGALMGATVMCPVLDEIGRDRCRTEQTRPFSASNSTRARLRRACRTCPHNLSAGDGS